MALTTYVEYGRNQRPRGGTLAVSAVLHTALFFLLVHPWSVELPKPTKSEYDQVIAGHEKQIVWYRFKKDLPDVSPARKESKKGPLKAENKAKQAITSSPKDAPRRNQMVWSPVPELKANPAPVESSNLLAIKLPDPPRPKAKDFTPPDAKTAEAPPLKEISPLPEPPAVKAEALPPVPVPELPTPAKPFTAPPVRAEAKPSRDLPSPEAPPELRAATPVPPPIKMGDIPTPRKRFVPPPTPVPAPTTNTAQVQLVTPPDITASFDASPSEVFHVPMSTPRRPYTPPPSRGGGSKAGRAIRVEATPPAAAPTSATPPGPANSTDLTLAVVGLNPVDKPVLPSAASPAEFTAGPVIRKDGATSVGEPKGLAVPDIFVRGAKDAKPDLIARAYAPVTSAENIRESMRTANPSLSARNVQPVPMRIGGAIQVSSAPDPIFQGRDVFMLAIQMPNLTSFSGSWLMWYAERAAMERGLGAVAPPVAYRKVDPKYAPEVVQERIEGRVQLACVIQRDGKVAGIEVRRGADERLNASAKEALSKWEFTPATRNGQPVDVDVLVEIPFRLEPKIKGPY